MNARQAMGVVAVAIFAVALILILWTFALLLPILAFLGLFLFLLIAGGLVLFALLAILLVPYYWVTKRPETKPGSYRLEDLEEK